MWTVAAKLKVVNLRWCFLCLPLVENLALLLLLFFLFLQGLSSGWVSATQAPNKVLSWVPSCCHSFGWHRLLFALWGHVVQCFESVMKTVVMEAHWCFSCHWPVVCRGKDFFCAALPARRARSWEGRATARAADPNSPRGYPIPYGDILRIKAGGMNLHEERHSEQGCLSSHTIIMCNEPGFPECS